MSIINFPTCATQSLSICSPRGGWRVRHKCSVVFLFVVLRIREPQCGLLDLQQAPRPPCFGGVSRTSQLGKRGRQIVPSPLRRRGQPSLPGSVLWFHFAPVLEMMFAAGLEETSLAGSLLPQIFHESALKACPHLTIWNSDEV